MQAVDEKKLETDEDFDEHGRGMASLFRKIAEGENEETPNPRTEQPSAQES